ncbi:MAG: hypothetical protein WB608_00675 [Terracidiphilus sp.]
MTTETPETHIVAALSSLTGIIRSKVPWRLEQIWVRAVAALRNPAGTPPQALRTRPTQVTPQAVFPE